MEDLRVIKTKKAIKEAFLQERKTKELNEVRVKTICEKALVNKSTFYKHYVDIIDLSNKLQDEAIDAFVEDFENKDKLFVDSVSFIKDFEKTLSKHFGNLYILFRDTNENIFKMLFKLKDKLYAVYDNITDSLEKKLLLTFVISGTFQAMATIKIEKFQNENECYEIIENIIKTLCEKYLNNN